MQFAEQILKPSWIISHQHCQNQLSAAAHSHDHQRYDENGLIMFCFGEAIPNGIAQFTYKNLPLEVPEPIVPEMSGF